MALHLHCKRSKMFIKADGASHKQVLCPRGETTVVPDWVKDDIGYKQGVKDGSIIDLTPPKAPKASPEPEAEPKPEPEPTVESTEESAEGPEAASQPSEGRKPSPRVPKGLQGASSVVRTK
jgi:hypothetical protein